MTLRRNFKRAGVLPAVLAVTSGLLLMQAAPTCTPGSLLETGPLAAETGGEAPLFSGQVEPGRTLTPEELDDLVANADDRGVVVVFMNPIPGPQGPEGPAGPPGPEGNPGADGLPGIEAIVGEVRMWAGHHGMLPPGWLPCDGGAVSRADFARLFNAIGTIYGAGDGRTTFALPDFHDRSPMGASAAGVRGEPLSTVEGRPVSHGGEALHTLTVSELPAHKHRFVHSHEFEATATGTTGSTMVQLADPTGATITVQTMSTIPGETDPTGDGLPHNNTHPYFAVRFMIYAGE